MLVSVIIPTYNRAHTLARAIDSVLAQTLPFPRQEMELIVVDDGSTDHTTEVLAPYLAAKKLRYLQGPNQGVSSARNRGAKAAQGSWLAFLDSDDSWLPLKLARQWEIACARPDLALIHGEEIWVRRGKRVNQRHIHQKSGGHIFQKCLPLCLISPSAALLKADLFWRMQGFDPSYPVCEDYDLWLKITAYHEVGFVPEPIITKYGGHDDQLSARFHSMDYWRLKSLQRHLHETILSKADRLAVAQIMQQKAQILLQGYHKHKNFHHLEEVESWLKEAQEASVLQSASEAEPSI